MKPASEGWLKQAQQDLRYARAALEDDFFAWVCFVCQQCAEKALKAFLVDKMGSIQKTHRLLALVEQCEKIDPLFSALRPKLDVLNQYYAPTRYADLHGSIAPYEQYTREMAEEAIGFAQDVLDCARGSLE
jgi:HEPN domain-containing protein